MKASIYKIEGDLYLIDLPQKLRGFRKFISSWVLKDGRSALIVDVGPASTIRLLKEALDQLGVEKVEYVLLTHIHIDHAGGIGHFVELYPDAKVVVNERGEKHLIDSTRLWEASKKVLGELAHAYGEIRPVPRENIYKGEVTFSGMDVEIIYTPGHAPHHQSYVLGEYLFGGEFAGVFLQLDNEMYLRPATPPRFIKEVYEGTLDKMLEVGRKKLCFGHFGMYEDSKKLIKMHKEQINVWVSIVREVMHEYPAEEVFKVLNIVKERLLEKDKLFANYLKLDEDIKEREEHFTKNSLMGIYNYLKTLESSQG
ncbi:MAG: MBL fold metallo-hydrolase [Candidatus Hydrothermae bacterium]|nr:MBL fold metallo-hydrolase [Candidatus Hydrothermae bacterium]